MASAGIRALQLLFAPVTEFSSRVGKGERRCASLLCAACLACALSTLFAATLLVVGSNWLRALLTDTAELVGDASAGGSTG